MTILTRNRILQKGDEVYSSTGEWQPVPSTEWGLQVEFSKYNNMQIRRPSETLPDRPSLEAAPAPISPDTSNTKVAQGTATPKATVEAEAKPVPASGFSPAGGESPANCALAQAIIAKGLPTVVSKKAHCEAVPKVKPLPEIKPAISLSKPDPKGVYQAISIPYPDKSDCIWIGRNGMFKARGVNLQALNGNIGIRPHGQRGLAKNAVIEFPAEIIPQVVDFLLRHQPTPK